MTYTDLPDQGLVFWPVGTGDSITIVVGDRLVMQVDLRDMKAADEDGAVVAPVIDRLAETLPTLPDGTPYLAVFALTHADLDHCCGFGDLLDSDILVGELWATPRLWRELADDEELCEDAQRFHDEAQRRVAATVKALAAGREPASGDRIRVIGYDDDRDQHGYAELPDEYFTFPGRAITSMDGVDVADRFEAFVHAPFRDDCAGERNETSLAMQITLRADDGTEGRLLLVGDLSYVTLKKIFDYSEGHDRPERLAWDVFLAAHHCSKSVMYAAGDDGEEEFKQDLLDRDRYEEIVPNAVLCTGEYPAADSPRPIVFGLQPGVGLVLLDVEDLEESERAAEATKALTGSQALLAALGTTALSAGAIWLARRRARRGTAAIRDAVEQTRGADAAPAASVGFGRR